MSLQVNTSTKRCPTGGLTGACDVQNTDWPTLPKIAMDSIVSYGKMEAFEAGGAQQFLTRKHH